MAEDFAERLSSISALAEPARRDLYLYVAAQPEPVSRDQAAAATGLPRHAVKFHLDRLVDEGLLEVQFRRLSGRAGPGAGRPAKLYRRTRAEISISLPKRRYDLAGSIFADALEIADLGTPIREALALAAARAGRRVGTEIAAGAAAAMSPVEALSTCGYEPRSTGDQVILANCPFHSLAVDHTELVCAMNFEFIRALSDALSEALGAGQMDVRLDPGPDRCCVTLQDPRNS